MESFISCTVPQQTFLPMVFDQLHRDAQPVLDSTAREFGELFEELIFSRIEKVYKEVTLIEKEISFHKTKGSEKVVIL
jgi:hypothetical protein